MFQEVIRTHGAKCSFIILHIGAGMVTSLILPTVRAKRHFRSLVPETLTWKMY